MTHRNLTPVSLVEALNDGPGEPHADVREAADAFETSERTVYRRISDYGIQRVYRWVLPDEEAA